MFEVTISVPTGFPRSAACLLFLIMIGAMPGIGLVPSTATAQPSATQPWAAQPSTARAQQRPLLVHAVSGLSFSPILRLGSSSVDYYSNNAASFEITGQAGEEVLLKIDAAGLVQQNGSTARGSMMLTITPEFCAYSLDGGANWTPFNPGLLWQQVRLPRGGDDRTTIAVRAGGRLSASAGQQRGTYTGLITLIAIYK